MASILSSRIHATLLFRPHRHVKLAWALSTAPVPGSPNHASTPIPSPSPPPSEHTHYKITLRRSAISLGDKIKGTLVSLGIHRRMQTVYHRHSPEVAGKILAVKELVEVENVPEALVRTKEQQTIDRKATRGYKVVGNRRDRFMNV